MAGSTSGPAVEGPALTDASCRVPPPGQLVLLTKRRLLSSGAPDMGVWNSKNSDKRCLVNDVWIAEGNRENQSGSRAYKTTTLSHLGQRLATSRLDKDSAGHPAPLHPDSCPPASASAPRPVHTAAFQGSSSPAAAAASVSQKHTARDRLWGSPGPLPLPGRPRGSAVSREARALQVPAAAAARETDFLQHKGARPSPGEATEACGQAPVPWVAAGPAGSCSSL